MSKLNWFRPKLKWLGSKPQGFRLVFTLMGAASLFIFAASQQSEASETLQSSEFASDQDGSPAQRSAEPTVRVQFLPSTESRLPSETRLEAPVGPDAPASDVRAVEAPAAAAVPSTPANNGPTPAEVAAYIARAHAKIRQGDIASARRLLNGPQAVMRRRLGWCSLKPTIPGCWPAGGFLGSSLTWRSQRPFTRKLKGGVRKVHVSVCLRCQSSDPLSRATQINFTLRGCMMKYPIRCLVGLALLGLFLQPCAAQDVPQGGRSTAFSETQRSGRSPTWLRPQQSGKPASTSDPLKDDANLWTVGVAGGLLEGTFIRYVADLAKVLDDGKNLRVIPMVTYGAVGNVTDLLNLRGVDVAITQADVLDHFRREVKIPDIENRFSTSRHCSLPRFTSMPGRSSRRSRTSPVERWRSTRPAVLPT